MEAVIGPALEQEGLVLIGALVIIVAQLMMDGDKVLGSDLGTHLDADVRAVINVPGRGVTNHFAVTWAGDLRALPKGLGQGGHADGGIEALASLDHLDRVIAVTEQ